MKELLILIATFFAAFSIAQTEAAAEVRVDTTTKTDTSFVISTTQDAIYTRPFINGSKSKIAVGGYVEANSNYQNEDGVVEGLSFEARRFNIFLFSDINERLRFLAELEFEHGTEEIALETAQLDYQFNPALTLRAGIILVPIGGFNQNHDSPRWNFVDRPLVSTSIIPSTLSEVGFGVNGKFYYQDFVFTYDAYLTNGLNNDIILNENGRTDLSLGKHEELMAEDNNGTPMVSGKLSLRKRSVGEIGISAYGGTYNTFRIDGEEIAEKNGLSIIALNYDSQVKNIGLSGELAYTRIDVPSTVPEFFGQRQWGFYQDITAPISKFKLAGQQINLSADFRIEYVDYNASYSGQSFDLGDEVFATVWGLSFRPSPQTVFKLNYRYHWITDVLSNPIAKSSNIQVGLSTYF